MHATTIDDAIALMDEIIAHAIQSGSRAGYFAALYRKVTVKIKEEIARGFFDDNPRMETFDVIFANRYLKAYHQWQTGKQPTMVWQTTFQAQENWRPLVLQHLLLGMNAHINLDLGIAAARTAPGNDLPALKNDFDRINSVLAGLVNTVLGGLIAIWPPLRLLTLGKADDVIINFSMERARDQAWKLAQTLAPLPLDEQEDEIRDVDYQMTRIGMELAEPDFLLRTALLPIRLSERGTVAEKIALLNQPPQEMEFATLSLLLNN